MKAITSSKKIKTPVVTKKMSCIKSSVSVCDFITVALDMFADTPYWSALI